MPSNDSLLQLFGAAPLWHPETNVYKSPVDALGDRTVLLYFSASWCNPCVRFTPQLIQTYSNLKQRGEAVEVVLCSLDIDPRWHASYARKMPFYALPLESLEVTKCLEAKFGAPSGAIPHVAIIQRDGTMMETDDAIAQIAADPFGKHFPWPPLPLRDVLPSHCCTYNQTTHEMDYVPLVTPNKFILLYFAAQWSPPCREFGPKLNHIYKQLKQTRNDFEFLLVSADRYEDEYFQHASSLSFGSLPFEDEACRVALVRRLKINGGPALVMLGPNSLEVINDKVCPNHLITSDFIAEFPYEPRSFGELKDCPLDMNAQKCLLVFCEEADDEVQHQVMQACQVAAQSLEGVKVLWTLNPNAVSESIRQMTQLPYNGNPAMVLLDLPDHGAYYVGPPVVQEVVQLPHQMIEFCKSPGMRRELV